MLRVSAPENQRGQSGVRLRFWRNFISRFVSTQNPPKSPSFGHSAPWGPATGLQSRDFKIFVLAVTFFSFELQKSLLRTKRAQKIIFIVKFSGFSKILSFRRDFFKKPKTRNIFFGPLQAVFWIFLASSKKFGQKYTYDLILRVWTGPWREI